MPWALLAPLQSKGALAAKRARRLSCELKRGLLPRGGGSAP